MFQFTTNSPVVVRKHPTKRPPPEQVVPEIQEKCAKFDAESLLRKQLQDREQMIKQLQEELTRKDQKIKEQKAKIRILQQKLRRNSNKMDNMNTLISDMKERQLLEPSVADQLDKHFHHLSKDIIINQFVNQDRSNKGHRHSDEVKKVCVNGTFL